MVAVAWLVIPVFLDGPEERRETVRQTVDLPGRDDQQMRTKTIVLDPKPAPAAEREQQKVTDPPPATRQSAAPEPTVQEKEAEPTAARQPPPAKTPALAEEKEDVAAEVAEKPAEEPASTTPATSGSSLWAVQLGSFSKQANAEKLATALRKQGFAAFLSRVDSSGEALHRVRVGPQGSREEAEQVAARLKSSGHDGQVVSHP